MEYAISVFILGLMVTALVGKGVLAAQDFAKEELKRLLKAALERHQILLKEMNHRIKNSLSIVSSMLRLQSKDSGPAAEQLEAAAHRVHTVARAHERLYQTEDVEHLDIGRYIEQVCSDVDESVAHCEILVDAQHARSLGCTLEAAPPWQLHPREGLLERCALIADASRSLR